MIIQKKIKPKTIGEIIFPKSKPNLNQILFNGDKIFEFLSPKIIKIALNNSDQNLTLLLLNRGYRAIIKKTTEKITPKLLLEFILIFDIYIMYTNQLFLCQKNQLFSIVLFQYF